MMFLTQQPKHKRKWPVGGAGQLHLLSNLSIKGIFCFSIKAMFCISGTNLRAPYRKRYGLHSLVLCSSIRFASCIKVYSWYYGYFQRGFVSLYYVWVLLGFRHEGHHAMIMVDLSIVTRKTHFDGFFWNCGDIHSISATLYTMIYGVSGIIECSP